MNNSKLEMTPFVAKERRVIAPEQSVAPPARERPVRERLWKRAEPLRSMSPRESKAKTAAEQEDSRKTMRILAKLGACAGICALVLALKVVDTPMTNMFTDQIKSAITTETSVDDVLGKLKFVDNTQSMSVFGADMAFVLPVNGHIQGNFGQDGRKGVELIATPGANVLACADGVVLAVGIDEAMGNYVRIQHAQKLETYSYGIAGVSVEEGQPLKMGDVLGRVQDSGVIYFEMHVNGRPQDPKALLERATMQ